MEASNIVSLLGKTIFITGASRGIGREIALKCARDGANVVLAAKTTDQQPVGLNGPHRLLKAKPADNS